MTRFLRRYVRPARLTLIWLAILFIAYLFVAYIFGLDLDGSGQKVPINPANATRNIFSLLTPFFRTVMPVVGYMFLFLAIGILQIVGLFYYISRGRTYTIFPGEYDVTFDDVRGQPHIVSATKEVMRLFQGYRNFKKVGGYPPHGILFEGPPGTGKTLLAKAIAGETGVPFLYSSGASFNGMFVGMGNMRVGRMFKKARVYSERYGGAVVFIDELDSAGASRGGVSSRRDADPGPRGPLRFIMPVGAGGGLNSMLVNELLTQMDGIDQPRRFRRWIRRTFRRPPGKTRPHNILVIGATNRASTLDVALLRPGRFDRKIHVGNPGEAGRKDIIAYYLNKVVHAPVDIDRVARATAGYSPAAIKNVINEALIFAKQDGRDALTYDDIWKAKLTDEIGLVEPTEYSDREKAATAIHEAGHAIASHFLRPWQPIQVVTVRKRGDTLGLVHSQEDEERHSRTRSEILAHIKVSLAGMVAEEIWLGESTTGPSSDLRSATWNAFSMITQLGMGSSLASLGVLSEEMETGIATAMRNDRIRDEIDEVLQRCKSEVRDLLEDKRPAMEALRDALIARDELTGDEFRNLLWEIGAVAEPPKVLPQLPVFAGNGGNGNGYPYGYGYPPPGYGYPYPGYGPAGPGMGGMPVPPPANARGGDIAPDEQ